MSTKGIYVSLNKFSKINFKCSCWRKLHQTYLYLQKVTVLLVVQVFWKFTPGIGPLEDNFLALYHTFRILCS